MKNFIKQLVQKLKATKAIYPYLHRSWYLSQTNKNWLIKISPILHYSTFGWKMNLQPHPLFDISWYLEKNSDIAMATIEPLYHYIATGWKEERSPHPLFNSKWYLDQNPDVRNANTEPLLHYLNYGWREGRQPHPSFNLDWFSLYDKKLKPKTNPLIDYLTNISSKYKISDYLTFTEKYNNHIDDIQYSKHTSLLNTQWNRINALFSAEINRCEFPILVEYVSLLLQCKKNGAMFNYFDNQPKAIINNNIIFLNKRYSMSKLYYLCHPVKHSKIICFVVLQYNKLELTKKCVASLIKLISNEYTIAIIIVDNKSSPEAIDNTREYFKDFTNVTLIFNDHNDGYARGNNIGYQYAKEHLNATYICVLNNDTVIENPNFIEKIITLFDDFGYSVLGPDIITKQNIHTNPWNDYIFDDYGWKKLNYTYKQYQKKFHDRNDYNFYTGGISSSYKKILFNPILQGAAYIFSPIFIKQNNIAFDDRTFLYGEEFLFATYNFLAGELMIYSDELQVHHAVGASTALIPAWNKTNIAYENIILASKLCHTALKRHKDASLGKAISSSSTELGDLITKNSSSILINFLLIQSMLNIDQEIKIRLITRLETYVTTSHLNIWITINLEHTIDEWLLNFCKKFSINIISIKNENEFSRLRMTYPFINSFDYFEL